MHAKQQQKTFDYDFAELEIKGRGVKGNQLTKYPVRRIKLSQRRRIYTWSIRNLLRYRNRNTQQRRNRRKIRRI